MIGLDAHEDEYENEDTGNGADVIRVTLSPHQQALFAQIRAEEVALRARRDHFATAILAGSHDVASLAGYTIEVTDNALVCTSLVLRMSQASQMSDQGTA